MNRSGYKPRPSGFRVHRQSPKARQNSRQYYLRNRSEIRAKAKRRYQQYKKNPVYRRKRQTSHRMIMSPRRASNVTPTTISIPFFYGEDLSEGTIIGVGESGCLFCVLENGEEIKVSPTYALLKFEFFSDNDIDTLDLIVSEDTGQETNPWEVICDPGELPSSSKVAEKWARQKGLFGPPGQRGGRGGKPQHTQLPAQKRQDARRYKSTPKNKRDSRMYYHLVCKRKPNCMRRREEYRKNPDKYKRRDSPLREASGLRLAGDIILFDQGNPSNREIQQPGRDVGYEATSPAHYRKSPDKKEGVPPSHDLPNPHHDDADPSSSRVIPDSMRENLQENLTYLDGGMHINAAAISPENLPLGFSVQVLKAVIGGGWKVSVFSESGKKVAHISISKPIGVGPCLGAYEVQNSWTELKGLGPLLYDIALELAGSSGLMSDRREVSEDARKIWRYYLTSRPDIKWVQLDNGTRNDDPEDDCKNSSAGTAWVESPLSKVYYKTGTPFLNSLKASGVLVEIPAIKRAALISDIFKNCSQELLEKSREVQYTRKSIHPDGMSTWTAKSSKGDSYTIRVKPAPKSKATKVVAKMPIQVSCSCPFFKWQGPEHWAKTNGYLYGKPEGSATKPSKRDPSGTHWACKHVLAVLGIVKKQRFARFGEVSWEGDLAHFPESGVSR